MSKLIGLLLVIAVVVWLYRRRRHVRQVESTAAAQQRLLKLCLGDTVAMERMIEDERQAWPSLTRADIIRRILDQRDHQERRWN